MIVMMGEVLVILHVVVAEMYVVLFVLVVEIATIICCCYYHCYRVGFGDVVGTLVHCTHFEHVLSRRLSHRTHIMP